MLPERRPSLVNVHAKLVVVAVCKVSKLQLPCSWNVAGDDGADVHRLYWTISTPLYWSQCLLLHADAVDALAWMAKRRR